MGNPGSLRGRETGGSETMNSLIQQENGGGLRGQVRGRSLGREPSRTATPRWRGHAEAVLSRSRTAVGQMVSARDTGFGRPVRVANLDAPPGTKRHGEPVCTAGDIPLRKELAAVAAGLRA